MCVGGRCVTFLAWWLLECHGRAVMQQFECPHPMAGQSPDNLDHCCQVVQIQSHHQVAVETRLKWDNSPGWEAAPVPVLGFFHRFSSCWRHLTFLFSLLIYCFGGLPARPVRGNSPGNFCEPKDAKGGNTQKGEKSPSKINYW